MSLTYTRFMPQIVSTVFFLLLATTVVADTYNFGVVPHRSALLTAQYWNPILDYVGKKSGITLHLQVSKSIADNITSIDEGAFDFSYSYQFLRPKAQTQKYKVILRPLGLKIRSQIVALNHSGILTLDDLQGSVVGFPGKNAFIAYALTMDFLLRNKITVTPVFGGNQEGILGQLKAGQVIAAGVSSQVMEAFALRENIDYRVLWESEPFYDLPIAAHPRIPASITQKIPSTFIAMVHDQK
jgi:phosphonate transport system substrate-binding protein